MCRYRYCCERIAVILEGRRHLGMDHLESEIYMVVGGVRCVKIREVSSFQRVVCTGFNGVGT